MCISRVLTAIKKAYHDPAKNPDIVLLKPLQITDQPSPIPFELTVLDQHVKGFILRQDDTPRKLGHRGNSNNLTVPPGWEKHLCQWQKAVLVQIQNQTELAIWFLPEHVKVSA